MKFLVITGLSGLASTLAFVGIVAAQQAGDVKSLRNDPLDVTNAIEDIYQQNEGRAARNYRQQPPIIPHSMEQYQIDLRTNQCLTCHDWSNAGERGAPTLSMTHYLDRNGTQLDTVSGTRWFCNQCHVPQADAPALVDNVFKPSSTR
ncbi:nitrate reductase cytochrome c-type subunit [Donghicola tyrosinivorans]|uniref:Periplasmic nitrate reductase, electron transfer subunit n=1 Tax=Donghicola tyrosinivorans TaxID=1652492 RepID=A0A2T0WHH0_9RHOB|nr:nitrate reductase cytochrome c-type subunit [Donghicola tyrosinivorans]PRY86147.1 cytochrome c-type protein NapB [Donghicola tyrosinivorans]